MADDASSSSGCTGNLVDNSINQDELIMKQQREIEKEVIILFIIIFLRSKFIFSRKHSSVDMLFVCFPDIRNYSIGR